MNETIVYFHVGRGGKFNNQGYKSFHGCKEISEILTLCDSGNKWSFWRNRDNKGKFISPAYFDQNGNFIISEKDVKSGVGILDWDGSYDTDICSYLRDCDEHELLLIIQSNEYNKENLIKEYFNECTDLNVDGLKFNGMYSDLITDYFNFSDCDINDYYIK